MANGRCITDLSEQEMLIILEQLLDYNVIAAANLSLTCQAFYHLFTDALASKLLHMLLDVTYLKKAPIPQIIKTIQELVELRPDLIFKATRAKNENDEGQDEVPITYVFKYLDLHFIKMFEKIAIEQKRIPEFLALAEAGFENHFDLIEHIRLATIKYLEVEKELNTDENPLPNELFDKAKEIIGSDQYDTVRWMFDAALIRHPEDKPEIAYADSTPPENYVVEQLHYNQPLDILAFENGKKLGKDITLTHTSKYGLQNTNGIIFADDAINDFTFFHHLFKTRERMVEKVIFSNKPTISAN